MGHALCNKYKVQECICIDSRVWECSLCFVCIYNAESDAKWDSDGP